MATELIRYPALPPDGKKLIATLGSFDGIHLGHRALLEELVNHTKGADSSRSAMISFYPHPAVKLGKAKTLPSLATLRKRLEILGEIGIDIFYLIHFTESLSKLSAEDFIRSVLIEKLQVATLWVGPDARLGRGGEGNVGNIAPILSGLGAELKVIPFLNVGGDRASSGNIRRALEKGAIAEANVLLGRRYSVEGRVVRGQERGRQIGFPTANLGALRNQMLPADGVYATVLVLNGKSFPSVTNIGLRPTFDGSRRSVESHIMGYNGSEFYGARVSLEFTGRIRDEKKFSSAAELSSQITLDIEAAKKISSLRQS